MTTEILDKMYFVYILLDDSQNGDVVPQRYPPIGHSVGIISPASDMTLYHPSSKMLSHTPVIAALATDLRQSSISFVVKHGSE